MTDKDKNKKTPPVPPCVPRRDSAMPVRSSVGTSAMDKLKLATAATSPTWKPGEAFEALRRK